jgi:hypothetical protein
VNRVDHRLTGSAAGLAVAAAAGVDSRWALAASLTAVVTSGGRFSPDADQYRSWGFWAPLWRAFARLVVIAGMLVGAKTWGWKATHSGDPAQHRGITHWWGVPLVWTVLASLGGWVWPSPWWLLAWAGIAGWASHLAGDALFGRRVWGDDGHGIPLAPWWRYWSPVPQRVRGLRSDGAAAHAFAFLVTVPASTFLALRIAGF